MPLEVACFAVRFTNDMTADDFRHLPGLARARNVQTHGAEQNRKAHDSEPTHQLKLLEN